MIETTMPKGRMPDIPLPPETRDQRLSAYLYTIREQIMFLSTEIDKLAARVAELEDENAQ